MERPRFYKHDAPLELAKHRTHRAASFDPRVIESADRWVGPRLRSARHHREGGRSLSLADSGRPARDQQLLFPSANRGAGRASINPTLPFQAHHGDLVIRGLKPGTNVLVVNWFYPGTGAASVCPLTIQVVAPAAGETSFQTSEGNGQLCTAEDQKYIESRSLRQMLDFYVPRATPKLLILNQCFAGNVAASVFFRDLTNTAIATGNSPNQEGH